MQKTVLILGARGRFGMAAVHAFTQAGWRVLAQCRPGARATALPGVQWLSLALTDHAALVQAARGAQVLVHAVNPLYTQWEQQALPALEDAIALAAELKALFMLPGNVYNFGAGMPELLCEDTAQLAHTRKGKIRVAMERRLRGASESGELRSVVLRAGDFFGSGSGSWFDLALTKNLRQGKLSYPGGWNLATSWAYLPDLALSFERVASLSLAEPQRLAPFEVLHFKGHRLSGADWATAIEPLAREQGWLAPGAALQRAGMPWWLFRALGWAVPMFRELAEMHYLWQTPYALANDKLQALIGPEPHTALNIATRAALNDLGLLVTKLTTAQPAAAL
jgi:nucleoside-diphosphate-sugar epimerase